MPVLDRALQRQLLEIMAGAYPGSTSAVSQVDQPIETVLANLAYLAEHGLCDAQLYESIGGNWSYGDQKITAQGLDFLADDGSLTAIWGTITVKLHAQTIRELIDAKIDQIEASSEEKRSLKSRLAAISEASLKSATEYLVQRGLTDLPDAISWIRTTRIGKNSWWVSSNPIQHLAAVKLAWQNGDSYVLDHERTAGQLARGD
jgi:hypothetical protein